MPAVGIICEYNPFHNGHLYHLKKVKELFPNHLIVLVLNGYFLERGDISLISKKDKTLLALNYGIDIVLELPFVFGTQSADVFANTAITMLEKFKCEYVIFGSESNDIEKLTTISKYTIKNASEYNKEVKELLDQGVNYPTALAKALNIDFKFNSNDLLGISYIKSIILNNYQIKPICIKRTNNYLDTLSNEEVVSATNIREKLNNNIDINKYVPDNSLPYIKNISLNDYFTILKYKIITEHDLSIYLDVDEGIDNRLKKVINKVNNTDELLDKIKTKRYTYNRLRRMMIHILIGLTKEDVKNLELDYIKVLGFNTLGQKYLNKIKKEINIPLVPIKNSLIYTYELKSAYLYDLITNENNIIMEHNTKPIKNK